MSPETKLACNRLPFQTDSSCDRGDVDIHVFDNLPICMPIDPTEPKTGIPQDDTPIIPITPPPCACAMVELSGSGTVSNINGVFVNGSFSSIGDCCDGNYRANINVDIPCIPFSISGGSKDKKITIETFCGDEDPSGTFNPGVIVNNCNITIDPSLSLKLPRPIDYSMTPELVLTNDCAVNASGSFTTVKSGSGCTVDFHPKLTLNIPPSPKLTVCEAGIVNIRGGLGATGSLDMGTSVDQCGNTNKVCPTLNLDIPCPIEFTQLKVKAELNWIKNKKKSDYVILKKIEECKLVPQDGKLDLGLPCPIEFQQAKLKAEVSWGQNTGEKIITILKKKEDCFLVDTNEKLNLQLKCPIEFQQAKLKAEVSWGQNTGEKIITILKKKEDCFLTDTNEKLNLQLKCPIEFSQAKVRASIGWGEKTSTETVILRKSGDCGLTSGGGSLDLALPCPIRFSQAKVKATIGWGKNSSAETVILTNTGDCGVASAGGSLDLALPCPIKLSTATVKANMSWDGSQSASAAIVQSDGDCGIVSSSETLDLGLPCPVNISPVVLNITTVKGKRGTSSVTLLSSSGKCGLIGGTHNITIGTGDDSDEDEGGGRKCPYMKDADLKIEGNKLVLVKTFVDCNGSEYSQRSSLRLETDNIVYKSEFNGETFYNYERKATVFKFETPEAKEVFETVAHSEC